MKKYLIIISLLIVIVFTFSFVFMKGTGIGPFGLSNLGLSFLGISPVDDDSVVAGGVWNEEEKVETPEPASQLIPKPIQKPVSTILPAVPVPTDPPPMVGLDSSPYVSLGVGNTNAFYIDDDRDGYGVAAQVVECRRNCGPTKQGLPGDKPDADDTDAETNTPATVIINYGNASSHFANWKNLLDRKFGFEVGNVYFISLNNTGATPQVNNINRPYPYSSLSSVISLAQGGDVIVFRGGDYYNLSPSGVALNIANKNIPISGRPLVFTSYPGELVSLQSFTGVGIHNSSNLIIDGFLVTCSGQCPGLGFWGGFKGFDIDNNNKIIIQNTEITRAQWGVHGGFRFGETTFRKVVIHDTAPEHLIYVPSNCYPAGVAPLIQRDITIEDSVLYGARRTPIQFNGPAENIKITRNIIHSNSNPITFTSGVQNSEISNNLIFNNNQSGIVIWHDNANPFPCTRNNQNIDITNNIIWQGTENNSICPSGGDRHNTLGWIACPNPDNPASFPAIRLADSRPSNLRQTFSGIRIRNNVLVTQSSPAISTSKLADIGTTVVENNIIYRTDGNGQNGLSSWDWAVNGETDGSHSSFEGNPRIYYWTVNALQNHASWGSRIRNNFSVTGVANLFQNVQTSHTSTPGSFNFLYSEASPAINFAVGNPGTNGIPALDLLRNTRTAPIDAGAYEAEGGGTLLSPNPPSNLTVTTLSASQLRLNWFDNSNNEQEFSIEYKLNSENNWSSAGVVAFDVTTFTHSNRSPGTSYNYRVRAHNSAGSSSWSNIAQGTTNGVAGVGLGTVTGVQVLPVGTNVLIVGNQIPIAPSNLTANSVSSSQLRLDWRDNSSNETRFEIERSSGGAFSLLSGASNLTANADSFTDTGLTSNTEYRYRVRAANAVGASDWSGVAEGRTASVSVGGGGGNNNSSRPSGGNIPNDSNVVTKPNTAVNPSNSASQMSVAELQNLLTSLRATLYNLLQQKASLLQQGGQVTSSSSSSQTNTPIGVRFARDLTLGSEGPDVRELQILLNEKGYIVASTGVGSPGNEGTHFGDLTRAALARLQRAYKIVPALGYFGEKTRQILGL